MTSASPRTLGDVTLLIEDCLHATASIVDEGFPLIRTPNIGRGRLDLESAYRVSQEIYEKWTRRATPEDNDLILAREATAGNVSIVKNGERVCLGQRTVLIRPNSKEVDPDYLCYFLLAPRQQSALLAGATGVTAAHVNMSDIRKLPLENLPGLDVQRRLGSVLAAYDDLVENNLRRIKLLEESARLLYDEWFVRLRFPGHEHTRAVNGLPKGWEKKELGEFATIIMGQSPKSQFYNQDGEGLPFHQGVSDFGGRFVTHSTHCTVDGRIAQPGDILCSVRAPVGRLNITLDKIVIGRGLSAIRSNSADQSFLYQQLRTHFFKEDIIGSGAIFASVTREQLATQKLLIPPLVLVREFEDTTIAIDRQIECLFRQNQKLKLARNILLPKLMSGEIQV